MSKGKPAGCTSFAMKEHFNRDFSFDPCDRLTPREDLLGQSLWSKRYRDEYGLSDHTPKETAFMKGSPSKFKGTTPSGKLRTSGKGHRIGKR